MTNRVNVPRIAQMAAAVGIAAATVVGLAPTVQAMPAPSRVFDSCAGLNAVYAGGVARTQAGADRVVRQGHLRPIVCPTAFAENRKFDRNRNGVICERRR